MIHPDTTLTYMNDAIGYGVVATRFIPRGTIVWVLDELDRKFDADYVKSLDPVMRSTIIKYSYRDYQGNYILCWDIARYVNHSFDSSMIGTAYNFEVAARDIYPGEELTDDYGYFNLEEPFDCLPEAGDARTQVMPDDIWHYYAEWDWKAAQAIKQSLHVAQPLWHLMTPSLREKVVAIATGQEPMDSILSIATWNL
ncbi:MAG: SET domain-containing protein [Cyanobacteria bacterium]|nr:SET domain-containing protein [Cyanobacteriota bacterium]MDW8200122.1 SET domain-containing protein [Cyanobacteriota bacterium SKYGB_h_bin112]